MTPEQIKKLNECQDAILQLDYFQKYLESLRKGECLGVSFSVFGSGASKAPESSNYRLEQGLSESDWNSILDLLESRRQMWKKEIENI